VIKSAHGPEARPPNQDEAAKPMPRVDLPAEFSLIARHFRPLAGPGALDLRDDAALLTPPPGRQLVLTADAMVAGVHFLPDDPPDLIGRKLLRVNLSDLAAKGAVPLGYLMTVSTPKHTPEAWFAAFAAGLALDQTIYGVTLLGGDTTSTPGPISLSLTIIGHVAPGTGVHRFGAQAGDELWVTGTIGDGALGLAAAQGKLADPTGFLLDRYRLPQPRIGLALAGIASAGMDISDGLVQDLGHICRASALGADLRAADVPLSDAARAAGPAWLETCLTGGDDYELLLAVPPARAEALRQAARHAGIPVTRVGHLHPGPADVMVRQANGEPLALTRGGWSHF
jgi:thiamine-monophosphate kinase